MGRMNPETRYWTLADRIRETGLSTLVDKADAVLRPFIDATAGDLVAIEVEPHQDEIGFFNGQWCWMATVSPSFSSKRDYGDLDLEFRLRIREGRAEVVSITCEPHEVRSMIEELVEQIPLPLAA